jgi:N utilization substance protein B
MTAAPKGGSRRRAREVAMQAIYLLDLNPATDSAVLSRFLAGRLADADARGFATRLVEGTRHNAPEIDALLESLSDNWRVSRMAATDRSILRLAVHEILHTATPPKVACDEAVELAKRYGAAASSRFVAGLLGRLLVDRGDGLPPDGPAASTVSGGGRCGTEAG